MVIGLGIVSVLPSGVFSCNEFSRDIFSFGIFPWDVVSFDELHVPSVKRRLLLEGVDDLDWLHEEVSSREEWPLFPSSVEKK